jgi:hypothetical protein
LEKKSHRKSHSKNPKNISFIFGSGKEKGKAYYDHAFYSA